MIKIESTTLEEAYTNAAASLKCSVTQLKIEVIQFPSKGMFGLFKKNAIIVATKEFESVPKEDTVTIVEIFQEIKIETEAKEHKKTEILTDTQEEKIPAILQVQKDSHTILNDTIMPTSFVSTQEDEEEDEKYTDIDFTADYDDAFDNKEETRISEIAKIVKEDINTLFDLTCFDVDEIGVSVYDENTLLVEFKGEDAALLIGKEGYRYKALSYIIFNWINTKYQLQLRLEIAEFLKNQEEAVSRYLVGVCEGIERDGRAQTKILDGVLVQIALKELRDKYPEKYVVIRSTRDGLKYIIVNDYHTN